GTGEALDGVRQVGVRARGAGDEAAEARQRAAKVKRIEPADHAIGLVALENGYLAAGAQHAMKLRETSGVVGEVAKAEGEGGEIERCFGEGKVHRIGFE